MELRKTVTFLLTIFIVYFICSFGINYETAKQKRIEIKNAVSVCNGYLEQKQYEQADICIYNLIDKYDNNEFRLSRTYVLLQLKKFDEAKYELNHILNTEKENKTLIEEAKDLLSETEKEILIRQKYKNSDIGSYFSDLKEVSVWKNPKRIKVYIDYNYPKGDIIEKAFKEWDKKMYGIIDFVFVDNKDEADIYAHTVDISFYNDIDAGGLTFNKHYEEGYKSFMEHAEVTVSYNDMTGQLRTDKEIYGIALHEVGHSLGMHSHSPQKNDIMYAKTSSYAIENSSISNRDINTVKRLYENI